MGIFGGAQSNVGAPDDRDKRAHVQRMQDEIQMMESDLKKHTQELDTLRHLKAKLAVNFKELSQKSNTNTSLLEKLKRDLSDAAILVKKLEREVDATHDVQKGLAREVDRMATDIRSNETEVVRKEREYAVLESDFKQKKKALQNESR